MLAMPSSGRYIHAERALGVVFPWGVSTLELALDPSPLAHTVVAAGPKTLVTSIDDTCGTSGSNFCHNRQKQEQQQQNNNSSNK